MMTIHIEKYVDGVKQESLSLPVGPLRFFADLLPSLAQRELSRHGLDLRALLEESATNAQAQWLDVREGGVQKQIRISRR